MSLLAHQCAVPDCSSLAATSEASAILVVGATIGGTVFEDTTGDHLLTGAIGDANNPGVAGAVINLWNDDGSVLGQPDANDTLERTTTSGPSGRYLFDGLVGGHEYWVSVDSTTIVASSGTTGWNGREPAWAEQTWGPTGAYTQTLGVRADPGPLYGGQTRNGPTRPAQRSTSPNT